MKLGAEPKKIAFLAGLSLAGAYLFYVNVLSQPGAPAPEPPRKTATSAPTAAPTAPAPKAQSAPRTAVSTAKRDPSGRRGGGIQEFRPSLKPKRPEDRPDPTTIDPTLRLDLLAKVQGIEHAGSSRNLFQFSAPPAPPAPKLPDVKIVPKTPAQIAQEKIQEAAKTSAAAAVKPPPAPINLKFYGYSTLRREGRKRAFFLDGDDILVAEEGEIVKKRYKVIRIGLNSVVMEDVDSKVQQTLAMLEEAG
ncbi:MAG: hypothetical protein EXQ52_08805 [Bryobacterales bacterium]|nr:hypothetical protein [Bryobacterales bacterium]